MNKRKSRTPGLNVVKLRVFKGQYKLKASLLTPDIPEYVIDCGTLFDNSVTKITMKLQQLKKGQICRRFFYFIFSFNQKLRARTCFMFHHGGCVLCAHLISIIFHFCCCCCCLLKMFFSLFHAIRKHLQLEYQPMKSFCSKFTQSNNKICFVQLKTDLLPNILNLLFPIHNSRQKVGERIGILEK